MTTHPLSKGQARRAAYAGQQAGVAVAGLFDTALPDPAPGWIARIDAGITATRPALPNAPTPDVLDLLHTATITDAPSVRRRRRGLRALFYRGQHRTGTLTVAIIQDHLRRNPWRLDHRGNRVLMYNCRVFGLPAGRNAFVTIAPSSAAVRIPSLPGLLPPWTNAYAGDGGGTLGCEGESAKWVGQ